jgi:(S)-2-hydroxy-acid oxidase
VIDSACRNREIARSLVATAERLGYRALVVTVDAPRLGNREADERNRFRLPEGLTLGNARHVPGAVSGAVRAEFESGGQEGGPALENIEDRGSKLAKLFTAELDDSLTWELIGWLKSICSLPVLVKVWSQHASSSHCLYPQAPAGCSIERPFERPA